MNFKKIILIFTTFIFTFSIFTQAYAHPLYAHPEFTDVLYSDEIGWLVNEITPGIPYHSADNNVTYEFVDSTFYNLVDGSDNSINADYLKTAFNSGAANWRNSIFNGTTFNVKETPGATFKVGAIFDLRVTSIAYVDSPNAEVVNISI